jgi:hypothetical protein
MKTLADSPFLGAGRGSADHSHREFLEGSVALQRRSLVKWGLVELVGLHCMERFVGHIHIFGWKQNGWLLFYNHIEYIDI